MKQGLASESSCGELRALLASYHKVYSFKTIFHKVQESYVLFDKPSEAALMQAIEDFAHEEGIFLYNKFANVVSAVCRAQFVSRFEDNKKANPKMAAELKIIVPNTVLLEKHHLEGSGTEAS